MCLGSGSSKPALAQRTLPAEGTRPVDETVKTQGAKTALKPGGGGFDFRPEIAAQAAKREWAEKGDLSDVPAVRRSDPGINL